MISAIIMSIVIAATPTLLAALGELVTEKSGVLNLGVEGMMLIGASTGFVAAYTTGSLFIGFVVAMLCACAASMIFAFLTLTLAANQVATGLALTIFGTGLSALIGDPYAGLAIQPLGPLLPESISGNPLLQAVLGYNVVVYLSIAATAGVAWFLMRTRSGLILRSVGVSDSSAHSIGYPVIRIRYMAVAFGGAMAGLAGAFFPLVTNPSWSEQMTNGRGWIALAVVVFASWKPWRGLFGAYLFACMGALELNCKATQACGIHSEFLAMMPYLAPIIALTLISARSDSERIDAPACLGKPFKPA
jgi:simple sugar transport system permease protein